MSIFFDSVIVLFLAASLALGINIWRDRKRQNTWESRHPRLTICTSLFLFFSFLVVIWGSFIEPRLLTTNHVSIDLPNFEPTKPVRLALISDIHVGTYKKDGWIRRVSKRIIEEKPDLVLLAGDFIVSKPKHARYLSEFSGLTLRIPTYAVLGDHDYDVRKRKNEISIKEEVASKVRETLQKAGAHVMANESQNLEINGAIFSLIGLDDWLSGRTQTEELKNQSTEKPVIVLVHNPDFILNPESKKADLILAGNTHGGQIRLPWIGPVPHLPSRLPRNFDEGLFTLQNGTKLFITSGISESGPRARLFNPPEIVILELR